MAKVIEVLRWTFSLAADLVEVSRDECGQPITRFAWFVVAESQHGDRYGYCAPCWRMTRTEREVPFRPQEFLAFCEAYHIDPMGSGFQPRHPRYGSLAWREMEPFVAQREREDEEGRC